MPDSTRAPESQEVQQLKSELRAVQRELQRQEETWRAQLEIAERVHASLLPKPVRHPRIDIDVRYVPVEKVGGDYCQVVCPSELCCYITMCDVTGHGIGPALLATRVSSEVRRLLFEQLQPMEVVQGLNAYVFEHFRKTEMLLSFFAAKFDLDRGLLTYCAAGHPGPFLIRQGSTAIEVLESQNILIGVTEHCLLDQPQCVQQVNPGDRLLAFTDGLTETRDANGHMLGTDGLARIATITCAGSLFETADCILTQVAAFRHGPPQDDMTLIIAELKAQQG